MKILLASSDTTSELSYTVVVGNEWGILKLRSLGVEYTGACCPL